MSTKNEELVNKIMNEFGVSSSIEGLFYVAIVVITLFILSHIAIRIIEDKK